MKIRLTLIVLVAVGSLLPFAGQARYYNTANGRFSQRDTFEGNKYDPQSSHKYLYATADPVNGLDPSGNVTLVESMAVTTIALGLEASYDAALITATAHSIRSYEKSLFPLVNIKASQVPAFHKELAQLCSDSYNQKTIGAPPWLPLTLGEKQSRGLGNSIWSDSSFFSELYMDQGRGSFVLAFRGTDNGGDWLSNIGQGALGPMLRTQYDQATALAGQVNAALGDSDLTITGHSLGGGLAAAAAFVTDRPCVTFNAAALNELGYFYYGGPYYSSSMVNYSIKGEILTTSQRGVFLAPPTTFCQQYQLDPAPQDAGPNIGGPGPLHMIYLHGMARVINALNVPN